MTRGVVCCLPSSSLLSAELLFPHFSVFSMFTDQVITYTLRYVLDMKKTLFATKLMQFHIVLYILKRTG